MTPLVLATPKLYVVIIADRHGGIEWQISP